MLIVSFEASLVLIEFMTCQGYVERHFLIKTINSKSMSNRNLFGESEVWENDIVERRAGESL